MVSQDGLSVQSRSQDNSEISLAMLKDLGNTDKKNMIQASVRCKEIYHLINEKKWADVVKKLDYQESDAKEWIEEHNNDGSTRWKSLLIHLACEKKPSLDVIKQLLRIYPESVNVKNYGGDLPIHIACREDADKDVIEALLIGDGYDCAKAKDCEGRLPLHLAASNKHVTVQTIQTLITMYDRATRTPDDFSLLPLHWACSKNASPRVIETIIQAYPYAVEAEDAWGRTPLSLAKMSKSSSKAQMIELLSRDVSSWTNALMSTVVTLSNKVLESEKKEHLYKEQNKTMGEMREVASEKDVQIEALKIELKNLQQRYDDEIEQLNKKHTEEIEKQKEESDAVITKLTAEKEEAEKKLEGLKELVDEVVGQLKEHQSIVEEKEASRKKLKQRAIDLLKKIESQKEETRAAYEQNKQLKKECHELQYELERKEAHLTELKSLFQQPMRVLIDSQNDSKSDAGSAFQGSRKSNDDKNSIIEDEVEDEKDMSDELKECTKLDDGSSCGSL